MKYFLLLLLLAGCASNEAILVSAGSSICTANTVAECERLSKTAASLNEGPLAEAIEAAKMK